MIRCCTYAGFLLLLFIQCRSHEQGEVSLDVPVSFSGIYPHLAYYNNESECGTGAVVPWAGRLWVITYGPHLPFGSSDKLYEISPDLRSIAREESVGGTPANRMIHRESDQLFIGPYAIDSTRNVRVIPYKETPGRYTGMARHLTDPLNKIYLATMEEGFYDVDVHTLSSTMIFEDANVSNEKGNDLAVSQPRSLLPGAHGKGAYSGQGVLVYSNNGEAVPEALNQFDIEAGALAEWDGREWKVVRRAQFVEVTGPGGIYGNNDAQRDPIWATGWDHKSVIVGLRDSAKWSFFRLPKASHSYDGAHGWNTEWPRIRDIGIAGKPDYLMTMHGMFWSFPSDFSLANSKGIRPRSAYLKVVGDFARWEDKVVFGCDDSAQKEFLNKRKVKGDIEGPGQSNSNLWFTSPETPDNLGPATAEGAVWLHENVNPGVPSEPFLFSGWPIRSAWINNEGTSATTFIFEVAPNGSGPWRQIAAFDLLPGQSRAADLRTYEGEWIRLVTRQNTIATAHFYYADNDERSASSHEMFNGVANVAEHDLSSGLLYGLGSNRRALGISAVKFVDGKPRDVGYYELNGQMRLERKEDPATESFIREKFAMPTNVVQVDDASVLIVDERERRWRLPLGDDRYSELTQKGALRLAREVATERDLFNCHGTFYELPAENADGFAKIRPIASHNFHIYDYASYRGMLIMSGINIGEAKGNKHIIVSDDGELAVWAGVIDDLWKLGKPRGKGGPWKNTLVRKDEPSDPYLIGFYDKRKLSLSHHSEAPVTIFLEAEPLGHGPWMRYKTFIVHPGEVVEYIFPAEFQSRWIRFRADRAVSATAWLEYD